MRKIDDSGKTLCQHPVELLGRRQVDPEWLLHDHPRSLGAVRRLQGLDDELEQAGGDGQVEGGSVGAYLGQCRRQPLERGGIAVVAPDVGETGGERGEGRLVVDAATEAVDAVAGPLAELVDGPVVTGHTDDGDVQPAAPDVAVQGVEDLLVRQVSGGAEQHQGIRCLAVGHGTPPLRSPPMSPGRRDLATSRSRRGPRRIAFCALSSPCAADPRPPP